MRRFLGMAFVALSCLALGARAACATVDEAAVRRAWCDACRIAEISPAPPLFIVETRGINAWVTDGEENREDKKTHRYSPQRPGGVHVDVTTGLMKLCETEEEMFGVLCHELGHFVMDSLTTSKKRREEARVTSAITASGLGHDWQTWLTERVAFGVAVNNYGRAEEQAADNYAIRIALKGGRDPMKGIYAALERLALNQGWSMFDPLEEHPSSKFRLSNIRERIKKIHENTGGVDLQ